MIRTNLRCQFHIPKREKNVHINMYLKIYNLWVISEGMLCTHQQQFRINMWAGIGGDCFACQHVSPHRLTGSN
jgi:hypothetical protein